MSTLLLVDGSNIMFRSYYGIRPFTTKTGLYTNAVYGTVTTLSSIIEELHPDYAAIAFDLPAPTRRHREFPDYKGTRKQTPPELKMQIPYVRRAAEALGVHVVDAEGYEADDILGTLAAMGEGSGHDVFILTGDRDALQLITDKTKLVFITNKGHILYDTAEFEREYGALPPRLVDIKALMGDTSDNIPGVPGVGEKTARTLLSEAGTLDGIYERIDDLSITPRLREKLLAGKESAYMSYSLATIDKNVPGLTTGTLAYTGADRAAMAELFGELEFYKLAERFGLSTGQHEESSPAPGADTAAPAADALPLDGAAADKLMSFPEVTVSVINGTVYIKADAVYSSRQDSAELCRLLSRVPVVCHDYKSLYIACGKYGISPRCAFDTMLAAYVLRAADSSYELSRVAMTYLGENTVPVRGEDTVTLTARLALAMKAEFARVDAEAEAAGERPASEVLYDIEIPLAPVLADMEAAGVRVDTDGVRRYSAQLSEAEAQLTEQIYMLAGQTFNINSPKQLGRVLFEDLGLPAGKKTKSGYSTDAETLESLRSYPIVDCILSYRQIAKLRGTYGDALADAADADGRIHTSFRQTVTATGRLSSTDPNLQNIPVRTELGRELRRYFTAGDGDHVLVDADYSQIELRLLAAISGDPIMSSAFLRGADIHAATAAEVFGVPEESVTRELRSRAKAVNFGIVYGIGDYSLSRDIGTSRKTAAEYIENYLSTYKGVDAYLKGSVALAHERGYVTTLCGRRRYIPEVTATNKMTRAFGERVAMNSPIQGTAADVIKLAMIGVHRALCESGLDARLILQVHDELIVECARSDAPAVEEILRREMESARPGGVRLSVPLTVEVRTAHSWYECK